MPLFTELKTCFSTIFLPSNPNPPQPLHHASHTHTHTHTHTSLLWAVSTFFILLCFSPLPLFSVKCKIETFKGLKLYLYYKHGFGEESSTRRRRSRSVRCRGMGHECTQFCGHHLGQQAGHVYPRLRFSIRYSSFSNSSSIIHPSSINQWLTLINWSINQSSHCTYCVLHQPALFHCIQVLLVTIYWLYFFSICHCITTCIGLVLFIMALMIPSYQFIYCYITLGNPIAVIDLLFQYIRV